MDKLYPLTHPQMRIWYVEKTFPETGVSNITATVRIREHIDFTALKKALNHVVRVNEALRTRIIEQGNTPKQYFTPYEEFEIGFWDFSNQPIEALYEWDTELSRLPMRYLDSPLFFFAMFKLNESDGGFFSKMHHFITDAWTEMLLYSQIMTAYRTFCEGGQPDPTPLPSYLEYIEREKKYLKSNRFIADQEYWINQFNPVPDLVTLQTKKPAKPTLAAKRKSFILSNEEAENIRTFCRNNEITVFSFLLTMLTIYINRITGSDDIVIGTPVLNRLNSREKKMAGMFISTVPLRFQIDEGAKYIDYARKITANWFTILRHQQYPYDMLQRNLRKINSNLDKLFEITISYQNAKLARELLLWDGSTRWHFAGYQYEPLVIHVNDHDDNGTLILNYDYNTSCFADREIEFIHSHLQSLLDDALLNPDKPINSLSLIGGEELSRIENFNQTSDDYDRSKLFINLFQQQVNQDPAADALIFHDNVVSFGGLDKMANQFAHCLRSAGICRDDIVAIMLPRGIELVASMLGVLKAGGAFLPIDPTYPPDRIRYVLQNSGTKLTITTPELAKRFSLERRAVISPNDKLITQAPISRPPLVNKPEDLVYVIYTSGSTGLPKGVMIKHSGLSSLLHALKKVMYFKSGEAVLSLSTVAFDLFILEVFPALVNGMKVIMTDENEQMFPALQKALIKKHGITKLLSTPMRMQMLLDHVHNNELQDVKEIMIGGDVFPRPLLKRIKDATSAKILNAYGPTEITIAATFKDLTNASEINIGRPIANTRIYILDKHMNMVPIGVPGEIFIGGEGLARGYLNSPELTKERFISNPFVPGETLYRTGDLGRWYPKGEIAYLGRIDSQVKIRGLRIELGEIENALRQFPEVCDAVVLDIEERGKKTLCAYIVPNGELDVHLLRKKLAKMIPLFMVPSFYMIIEAIPLNSSGKIDRRALPLPDKSQNRSNYEPPAGPDENKLAGIWEEILGVKDISADEDFFALGGDSLDAVNLVTAIHANFGVEITINDIYDQPVLRNQAAKISSLKIPAQITSGHPNLVALTGSRGDNRLFLVHAGNGEINNYYELARLLSKDICIYGVRYLAQGLAPCNLTVATLAARYLKQIKEIQPQGPYYLGGWCLGGTIAFEMARHLEEAGEEVAFLALINSLSPRSWEGTALFTIDTERNFLSEFVCQQDKSYLAGIKDMEELWQSGCNLLSMDRKAEEKLRQAIPDDVSITIPNFCRTDVSTLIKYLNTIRTLHNARAFYRPPGMLKTKTCFLEATANDVIAEKDVNLAGWQRYCSEPIHRISVAGDHFSIFNSPNVEQLAAKLIFLLQI